MGMQMEKLMNPVEVVIMPHENITIELLGRSWEVEFNEWQRYSGSSRGFSLCGIRIDGSERTLVRVNADFIERINHVEFKFIPKPKL